MGNVCMKPAKIHFQKTGKNMTSKAGLIPVIKFLDKFGFSQLFQKTVHHKRNENAVYRLEDGVFLILTGSIGGTFNIKIRIALVRLRRTTNGGSMASNPRRTNVGSPFQRSQRASYRVHLICVADKLLTG